ncbi:MAG: glycerol-3-phosphate acyltransferase, partial [Actinobacteria bacterium]|nr:glycerol-3-phosphate acyltransferase [Actinomycetota bacterium]
MLIVDAWDVVAVVGGYLLGSVDFGVIVPRLFGVDIYGTGSGNPGATNVLRAMGRKQAAPVLLG